MPSNVRPAKFESIRPCTGGPKGYKYLHGVHPGLKGGTELAAEADRSEISVFLDGSGYEGHIMVGSSTLQGGEEKCSIRKFMGSEERHMYSKLSCSASLWQWKW